MRLQNYLNEKFFNAFKYGGKTKEIFVNPSKKEMRDMFQSTSDYVSVGFICDNIDDNIWFFLRNNIIHQQAFDHIKPGKKLYRDGRYLTGEIQIRSGRVQDVNFQSFKSFSGYDVVKEVLNADWSYFDKWIPNINKELHSFFSNWKKMYSGSWDK